LTFKHEGRQESVADPVDIKIWYGIPEIFSYYEYWDSGNIYCETGCHDYQINIRRPGPHMITDVKGNDLKWDDIKNGTTVKIRAIYTSWEGYNYLYSAASGKYSCLQKLNILKLLRIQIYDSFVNFNLFILSNRMDLL